MPPSYLKDFREYELDLVLSLIPVKAKLLEIGAGAGWQARKLAEHGFDVQAIDIEESIYREIQVWPVTAYDGWHIPFPDRCFDMVFSSNVLEHIPHVDQFQAEIKRVLKPQGLAIHILPTAAWRFWTIVLYYAARIKQIITISYSKSCSTVNLDSNNNINKIIKVGIRGMLNRLFPPRHGALGNTMSELYLFSRFRWLACFRTSGWVVDQYFSARLFYTGYSFLGPHLVIKYRHFLSFMLGSTCLIYVLKKA
jgi:SAM-dependent methyltransferase